jgi:hypothetical protein
MKTTLTIFLLLFIAAQSFGQTDTTKTIKKDSAVWAYQYTYDRMIQSKMFTPGMSDDEMAGIMLYRSGKNLKRAFILEIFGVLTATVSLSVFEHSESTATVFGVFSLGFFAAGIGNIISGYTKISKAGIIMQHKGIQIQTTGTSISMKF